MRPIRLPLLVVAICLPVALLALGVKLPGSDRAAWAQPVGVPAGDCELAWFHTTTSSATWERFVAGVGLVATRVPGLTVDESHAFGDQTHDVPEVVLSYADRPGKVRIRWYKTTNDVTVSDWVKALASRDPAPLAVVGGGSSDRAKDMAVAMNRQTAWVGERPLLFITTASADQVPVEADADGNTQKKLVDVYDGRTFRFCFTNDQATDAVLSFVWSHGLRPAGPGFWATAAVTGAGYAAAVDRPVVHNLSWSDDPYSVDLSDHFGTALRGGFTAEPFITNYQLPMSIGAYSRPNRGEAAAVKAVVDDLRSRPNQRVILVLPTVAAPARRILTRVCEEVPDADRRLVAVMGDGIPFNAVYRDGEYAWPMDSLPVPLVFFTHHNPVAWADSGPACRHPNETDDVRHFAKMMRVIVDCVYAPGEGIVHSTDLLARRLYNRTPVVFDTDGNRLDRSGEYVIVLRPRRSDEPLGRTGALTVYTRTLEKDWRLVDSLALPAGTAPVRADE
jgi:hypothetical protein